ncbi:N-acetylmuramoyl-L-alanine amidase [Acidiphilium sp. PA]|uniref:N-acetylmuramoyl-L-alanine amidase family protein n=1 Tax=Acidiphilium sp. PA TaxID=2871705 RepID=UPI0022434310|nr:N-acetylmuramoyl-L-alanine amidase [Acidiphilium sp. PA]MCW8305608.1 N-acetylmuramoyl-L-alanine amidase [Acidiphilium sp. PA]
MSFSRRFLLDAGVKATISLPLWMQAALARASGPDRARMISPAAYREATRHRLVVIDPGHGGHDPGCIGQGNLFEKDIALSAAWDLRHALERGGYEVVMTRARDVFIPLQNRVDIAEKHKAALFLSMHANSVAPNTTVRGASVYTFSDQASDGLAATIARSENSVERISNPTFRGVSPQVGKILFSLMAHSTKIESLLLQRKMVGSLGREVPMLPNPARHATFAVLQSSAIPSVLVETAFLSNPQDEAALRTNAFRERIAGSMKAAVDAWFLARRHAVANL